MNRSLVVVSNRLPFRVVREGSRHVLQPSAGGLVTALEPALRSRGGVWVGWSGLEHEPIDDCDIKLPSRDGIRYVDVPLNSHDVAGYYHSFSNRTLWPLFHSFVGRAVIDSATWRAYERVNERFANTTAHALAHHDALVWIHDYQLLRAAHHLRRLRPQLALAFFLHVPFPAVDLFRILPWSRDLLRGMLAADYVGFHTASYATNFLQCADHLLGCTVDGTGGTVRFEGRLVGVGVHPISIDVEEADRLTARAGAPRADGVRQIVGVDRLDYTKGIVLRLEAIERLLDRFPAYRRRVRFTQVLVPSREHVRDYRDLKREIDETVGRINGRFSVEGWTPIRYFARSLTREALFEAYRSADVALVTPLRDGMNLVAKEYVMAQPDGDGVLVLSELAGVADEFQEAVTVTPFDADAVATALHRALSMAPDERRARMLALRARVRSHDVHAWTAQFVTAADRAVTTARSTQESPLDGVLRRLTPWLVTHETLALLLDYDGTLTPIVEDPASATLSPDVRSTLELARRNPNIDVMIVTGRSLDDIQRRVRIPGLTYVANHGFDIAGPGISLHHAAAAEYAASVDAAAQDLRRAGVRGAIVEPKGATLSFHYRGVAPGAQSQARAAAERIMRKRKLAVTHGKLVVEGRPPAAWDKGAAVLWALTQRHGERWPSRVCALYIGDDATDEDAFRSLHGLGRSIRVATATENGGTLADFTLPDPPAVLDLLRWIAARAFAGASG